MIKFLSWIWTNAIGPYIVTAMLNIGSEGIEAFLHLYETLYVLCLFLFGRSHRTYPSVHLRAGRSTDFETGDSEREEEEVFPVFIQRRILLGKKGEIDQWFASVAGVPLFQQTAPLKRYPPLHSLVKKVMGLLWRPRHSRPERPPYKGPRQSAPEAQERSEDYSSSANSAHPSRRRVYDRVSMDSNSSPKNKHEVGITKMHVLTYAATRQKVLVLDLDETLCHVATSTASMRGPPTFSEVVPNASGGELFHIWERPYVHHFLTTAAKLFKLVLFTSSSSPYADTILKHIDADRVIKERYYRGNCLVMTRGELAALVEKKRCLRATSSPRVSASETGSKRANRSDTDGDAPLPLFPQRRYPHQPSSEDEDEEGAAVPPQRENNNFFTGYTKASFSEKSRVLVKDLKILKVPPELLIMVDNSEECTLLNRDNALIIPPFIPSEERKEKHDDEVLLSLISFLECLLCVPDVRSVLRKGNITA